MTHRLRAVVRLVLVTLGSVTALALAATPAAAHAKVVRTTPASGASIDGTLKEITVAFDDDVQLVPHALVVTGGTGAPLTTGAPRIVGDRVLQVAVLDRLVPGSYFVGWRILSDDGHVETGSFGFTVAAAGAVAQAAPVSAAPPPPAQPVWPVAVAAALAAAAVIGGALVTARGLAAVRAAGLLVPYPDEELLGDAASPRERTASRR
jgi:copper resistance protein C